MWFGLTSWFDAAAGLFRPFRSDSRLPVEATTLLANASGYEMPSGNSDYAIFSPGVRSGVGIKPADLTPSLTLVNGKGILVYLNVTAAPGATGVRPIVDGQDPVSGNWVEMGARPAYMTAVGIGCYCWYPGASSGAAGGDVKTVTQVPLPRVIRIRVQHGDAANWNYSVGATVLS